jgi:type IV fimbrial biogenesis protein FimT
MASSYRYPSRRQHGFSLLEMLTTMGIVVILAAVAVPGFDTMMKNNRRQQAVDNFWHAIFLARSEAIKRNSVVVLCKSSNGTQCNNNPGNWADGWIVFDNLDRDEPAQVDDGEPVLRIYNATEQVSVTYDGERQTFAFRPFAQRFANGTIVFCDARGSNEARAIIISQTGRPRQSKRNASNGRLDCSNT